MSSLNKVVDFIVGLIPEPSSPDFKTLISRLEIEMGKREKSMVKEGLIPTVDDMLLAMGGYSKNIAINTSRCISIGIKRREILRQDSKYSELWNSRSDLYAASLENFQRDVAFKTEPGRYK